MRSLTKLKSTLLKLYKSINKNYAILFLVFLNIGILFYIFAHSNFDFELKIELVLGIFTIVLSFFAINASLTSNKIAMQALTSDRAWVFINDAHFYFEYESPPDENPDLEYKNRFRFKIKVDNYGNTPALNVKIITRIDIKSENFFNKAEEINNIAPKSRHEIVFLIEDEHFSDENKMGGLKLKNAVDMNNAILIINLQYSDLYDIEGANRTHEEKYSLKLYTGADYQENDIYGVLTPI